jgi:hypothetical protein
VAERRLQAQRSHLPPERSGETLIASTNREGDIAMKEIRCSEVGLFPDCQGVMRGENEDEVLAAAAEHGRTVGGSPWITLPPI